MLESWGRNQCDAFEEQKYGHWSCRILGESSRRWNRITWGFWPQGEEMCFVLSATKSLWKILNWQITWFRKEVICSPLVLAQENAECVLAAVAILFNSSQFTLWDAHFVSWNHSKPHQRQNFCGLGWFSAFGKDLGFPLEPGLFFWWTWKKFSFLLGS